MKKITLLIFFIFLSLQLYSQIVADNSWKNHVTTTFQGLDKNRVQHSVLLDFAMEFTNVEAYKGNLTDTTAVDLDVYGNIYKTLFMGRVTTDTTYFPEIKTLAQHWANKRLEFNEVHQGQNTIILGGLYYKYSKINPTALSSGKITVSNNRYYDKYTNGVWQNPYLTGQTVAFAPSLTGYNKRNFQVVLPAALMLGNSLGSIQKIELNANDGQGYKELNYDLSTNISYSYNGTYDWIFKITLTNNTVLYSKSKVKINEPLTGKTTQLSLAAFENDIQISGPGGSIFLPNGATLRMDYAPGHNGEIRKPFIVAEGFDTGAILSPEKEGGDNTLSDFITDPNKLPNSGNLQSLLHGSSQEYDIIYIDWYNGTADLRDNSVVLENVLNWVNANKVGSEPNVLLGQSMGGVIGRYTLARMEEENNTHDVRLFISHDAPLQGSNTPLSTQFFSRHMYNAYSTAPILHGIGESLMPLVTSFQGLISDAINAFGGNSTVDPYVSPDDVFTLQDTPAAVQMNYQWVSFFENVTSDLHDNWQQVFDAMGYPSDSRNIAISNGNECGVNQGFAPGDLLASIHDIDNPDFFGDLLHFVLGTPLIGIALNDIGLSIVGALPGSSKYFYDFDLRSTPNLNSGNRNVYSGEISYEKKFLWLIPIKYTITKRDKNAPSGSLPYDSYSGGFFDIEDALDEFPQVFPPTMIVNPQYSFIPVVSALDVKRNNGEPNPGDYLKSYGGGSITEPGLSSAFDNFIVDFDSGAAINNEHISFQPRNGNWLANELNEDGNVIFDCSFTCKPILIEGGSNLCSSGVYSIQTGANVQWSASPTNLVNISNNGSSNVTVTPVNSSSKGSVTLTATISSPSCGSKTLTKDVWVGKPNEVTRLSHVSFGCTMGEIFAKPALGAEQYEWQVTGAVITDNGGTSYINGSSIFVDPHDNLNSFTVKVRSINSCGTSEWYTKTIPMDCSGGPTPLSTSPEVDNDASENIVAYPNPAKDQITVIVREDFEYSKSRPKEIHAIRVLDQNSIERQYYTFKQNRTVQTIDISYLTPGLNFLLIYTDTGVITKKILVR